MSADESVGDDVEGDVASVSIDLSDATERWQYTCPNGHRNWRPTNSHVYCDACNEQGDDADHWSIIDQRDGSTIDWSDVEVEGKS